MLVIFLAGHSACLFAQVNSPAGFNVSLSEAVQFAKSQNKWVQAARIEQSAAGEDRQDAYRAALPTVNVSGSYQRFSDLTLFTEGLSHSTTGPRRPTPNAAAFGVDALFNIYSGGRQRAFQKEQTSRLGLAKINAEDQSGNIALQTAGQYLDLVRLADLKKYIQDQLKRAQTRLRNINALYKNQKVTKSDVLRAEVMLSTVELSLQQTDNDIIIANQKLDVLMNVPDSVRVNPTDSAAMPKPVPDSLLQLIERSGISSYSVRKAAENVEIQRARVRGIQSANMPSLAFYTAYGLNYPNYLFFPSVNQAYAVGFVGLKAQYSISSLYHNKSKVAAGKLRVKELELQQQATADNITTDVKSYYIKYIEALNRIAVNQRSVEQSQVNYRIVTTKYFNQLALLTDLLDADNLLQESRFNLIRAQTDALTIYYHLLYTSGNL
ncbi:TolC family protein [Mucilaginibacter sp. ZT4R22]|uniref:TolC family protein n=1 Tax=Mucilaginibacter pankratovii TaxID=2772110 RepID=A0ABR7WJV7_9SPHI|nr:TolC family protein [Mucilaginibacter pankratovii]MBD1362604.1 TolC family protein [Mucilaginibacter pankratovii]